MINEYDVVKSLKNLSDKVSQDCIGTVVVVYPDFPMVFEVEFFDDEMETLEVLTVQEYDIIKIDVNPDLKYRT
jgi:hypothetical protein